MRSTVADETYRLPELGRAYLVELEPGLDRSRLVGISCNIMLLPGVVAVVDMGAVSRETVDQFLLPDDQKLHQDQPRKARKW